MAHIPCVLAVQGEHPVEVAALEHRFIEGGRRDDLHGLAADLPDLVVDTDRDDLGACAVDAILIRCQPNQLATAVRSPVAAVEEQQDGSFGATQCQDVVEDARLGRGGVGHQARSRISSATRAPWVFCRK